MEHRFSEPAVAESNREPERSLQPGRVTMASNAVRLATTALQLAGLVLVAVAAGTPVWFKLRVAGVNFLSVGLFQMCDLLNSYGCWTPQDQQPETWVRTAVIVGLLGLVCSALGLAAALANAALARKGSKNKPVKVICLVATVAAVALLITSLSVYGANVDGEIKLFGLLPVANVTHTMGYSAAILIVGIIIHAVVAVGHLFDVVMAFQ